MDGPVQDLARGPESQRAPSEVAHSGGAHPGTLYCVTLPAGRSQPPRILPPRCTCRYFRPCTVERTSSESLRDLLFPLRDPASCASTLLFFFRAGGGRKEKAREKELERKRERENWKACDAAEVAQFKSYNENTSRNK